MGNVFSIFGIFGRKIRFERKRERGIFGKSWKNICNASRPFLKGELEKNFGKIRHESIKNTFISVIFPLPSNYQHEQLSRGSGKII